MISGITLILLSIIAVPSLILSKRPDAKEILEKIAPYQGWIGLIFCIWGVYGVIFSGLFGLGWITSSPIYWGTTLSVNILQAILGFMLGFALISRYFLSGSAEAKAKGEQLLAKIVSRQGMIGMIGIGVGIWSIVADFMFHV